MLDWLALLIGQQVMSRGLTFVLNVLIARHLDHGSIGIMVVHLALLDATVLFVSREPLRRVCLRDPHRVQSALNASWLITFPLSILLTSMTMFGAVYPSIYSEISGYRLCMELYAVGLLIDILTEPMYVVATMKGRIAFRVAIESVATVVRVLSIAVLVVSPIRAGITSFGIGQILYSTVKVAAFYGDSIRNGQPIFPRQIFHRDAPNGAAKGHYIDSGMTKLTRSFALQSVEKYLLTEGERIVLVAFGKDVGAQGVYGIVQNLGSLVARFLLQPVEEIAAMRFSDKNESTGSKRELLSVLLKAMMLIGLISITFGHGYSYLILHVLYGSTWSNSEAPSILSLYSGYVLFLAINGVSEAFVFSVMSTHDMSRYNIWLIVFAGIHIIGSWLCLPFGPSGLLFASSLNMICRIIYSALYIEWNYGKLSQLIFSSLPSPQVAVSLLISAMIIHASRAWFDLESGKPPMRSFAGHALIGVVCLIAIGIVVLLFEKNFIRQSKKILRSKKKD